MALFKTSDRGRPSREDPFGIAQAAGDHRLRQIARRFDWSSDDEAVMGWIMAQKCIDLASALSAFFNGDPGRFNYLPGRDVPARYRGTVRLLDNIRGRVNSGFYRPRPGLAVVGHARTRAQTWLRAQNADRAEGRRGRWVLDEALIGGVLSAAPAPDADVSRRLAALRRLPTPRAGLLRLLLPGPG